MEERQQESFDEPPHGVVSGADPRRLYAVIVVLLAVIVVLAIRPWGGDTAAPDRTGDGQASPGQGAAGEPTDTMDASLVAPTSPALPDDAAALVETCGSPSGWRAATLQEWTGRSLPIRSWIAIEPTTASGPLDPAIPFVPVATGIVTAIGYCAPLEEASRPPAVAVASLWALRDGQAIPLSLLPLEPSSPNALGGLWKRPAEVANEPGASPAPAADVWPPGRYVIELASPGLEYHLWLGVEIADLTLLQASPSARPSASGASPSASGSPEP